MFTNVPTADKICKIELQIITTITTDSESFFKFNTPFICNERCEIEKPLIFHLKQIFNIVFYRSFKKCISRETFV